MKKADVKFAEFVKANPKYKEPKVGIGVTEILYSDCHAYMITAVDPDKKGFTMTRMAPRLVGSYFEQNYVYEDENGNPLLGTGKTHIRFKYHDWHEGSQAIRLNIGTAREYEDPTF